MSYLKDRRNTYGENDKSSRKNIPRAKQLVNQANRTAVRQGLAGVTSESDAEAMEERVLTTLGKRPKRWAKSAAEPLGEVLLRRLAREVQAGVAGQHSADQMDRIRQRMRRREG